MEPKKELELSAFMLGFQYGKENGEASPREAETELSKRNFPHIDGVADLFGQGSIDGSKGDCFRLLYYWRD